MSISSAFATIGSVAEKYKKSGMLNIAAIQVEGNPNEFETIFSES